MIQLHDALPGFINEVLIFIDGFATSVPNVDSVIVFKLPMAITLHGE
jgi:hypothetical protein